MLIIYYSILCAILMGTYTYLVIVKVIIILIEWFGFEPHTSN